MPTRLPRWKLLLPDCHRALQLESAWSHNGPMSERPPGLSKNQPLNPPGAAEGFTSATSSGKIRLAQCRGWKRTPPHRQPCGNAPLLLVPQSQQPGSVAQRDSSGFRLSVGAFFLWMCFQRPFFVFCFVRACRNILLKNVRQCCSPFVSLPRVAICLGLLFGVVHSGAAWWQSPPSCLFSLPHWPHTRGPSCRVGGP